MFFTETCPTTDSMHSGCGAELSSPDQLESFCNDIRVDKCKRYISHSDQMFGSLNVRVHFSILVLGHGPHILMSRKGDDVLTPCTLVTFLIGRRNALGILVEVFLKSTAERWARKR